MDHEYVMDTVIHLWNSWATKNKNFMFCVYFDLYPTINGKMMKGN